MTSDTHRILVTTEALSSLRGIASYINAQSPQNATLVIDRILNGIDSLGSMPERFKRVGTSRKYGRPIHVLVIRPFLIYYRVDNSPATVYILNVRHGSRRQPTRFR